MSVVWMLGWEETPVPLALAGGLVLANAAYRQKLIEDLTKSGATVAPVTLVPDPAEGAVRLALRSTAVTRRSP
jgi:N-acetylglucosamine kinase-like BadF-type ATPase